MAVEVQLAAHYEQAAFVEEGLLRGKAFIRVLARPWLHGAMKVTVRSNRDAGMFCSVTPVTPVTFRPAAAIS